MAALERLIDPALSFQIGIRTVIPLELALNVITADKALKMGAEAIVDQIRFQMSSSCHQSTSLFYLTAITSPCVLLLCRHAPVNRKRQAHLQCDP